MKILLENYVLGWNWNFVIIQVVLKRILYHLNISLTKAYSVIFFFFYPFYWRKWANLDSFYCFY